MEKVNELLSKKNLKEELKQNLDNLLMDKTDVTSFLIWFIENYPASYNTMKENPEYQNMFK